jgi:hypothetical protein
MPFRVKPFKLRTSAHKIWGKYHLMRAALVCREPFKNKHLIKCVWQNASLLRSARPSLKPSFLHYWINIFKWPKTIRVSMPPHPHFPATGGCQTSTFLLNINKSDNDIWWLIHKLQIQQVTNFNITNNVLFMYITYIYIKNVKQIIH